MSRTFTYKSDDGFDLQILTYADPFGKLPLVQIDLAGHIAWKGDHPIATGAYQVDFTADSVYAVTPLHSGFVDILNKVAATSFDVWEVGKKQSIFKKTFAPFGQAENQLFKEYDLIYLVNDLLFWGARNVDGRGFDTAENRPTNLQIPLMRKA